MANRRKVTVNAADVKTESTGNTVGDVVNMLLKLDWKIHQADVKANHRMILLILASRAQCDQSSGDADDVRRR